VEAHRGHDDDPGDGHGAKGESRAHGKWCPWGPAAGRGEQVDKPRAPAAAHHPFRCSQLQNDFPATFAMAEVKENTPSNLRRKGAFDKTEQVLG
jgi:hypothetical protein